MTIDPGQPTTNPPAPNETPGIEEIPDLVGYVSFALPTIDSWWPAEAAPATPGSDDFIGGMLYGFLWVGWFLRSTMRESLVGIVWLGQYGANFLATAINGVLGAVNGLWRLGVVSWLGIKAIFYAAWGMGEDFRAWFASLSSWLAYPRAWLMAIVEVISLVIDTALKGFEIASAIVMGLIGIIGWIVGLLVNLVLMILARITESPQGPQAMGPSVLNSDSAIYYIIHGILRGFKDSALGWALYVLWGFAYIGFIVGAANYFSKRST